MLESEPWLGSRCTGRAGCAMGGPSKTPCGGAGLGAKLLGPNDPEDPGLPDVANGTCCW